MPALERTALVSAPPGLVLGALLEVGRVADVRSSSVDLVLHSRVHLTGTCAAAGAGTLLTCSLAGFARRALLDTLVSQVQTRAEALVSAPVVVGAAIVRDGRVLAQQRGFPADIAGMWELPGGRVEPGESDSAAVRRECAEELGVSVVPGPPLGPDVLLPSGKLLRIYRATLAGAAEPVAREHKALRWLGPGELSEVDWLPADRVILPAIFG